MAKRKVADMTYAQKVAHANDKFRAEALAAALETTDLHNAGRTDDIDQFRKDSYKQALKEAKS